VRIFPCGGGEARTVRYEADSATLVRSKQWMRGHIGAFVAVVRKLAVIMHRMWLDGSRFRFGAAVGNENCTGVNRTTALATACLRLGESRPIDGLTAEIERWFRPVAERPLVDRGGCGAHDFFRRRHRFGSRACAGMTVLLRSPDMDVCARSTRGAEHELLHGARGVVVQREQIRSLIVDRRRQLVYDG
jgi:hypothetical protein